MEILLVVELVTMLVLVQRLVKERALVKELLLKLAKAKAKGNRSEQVREL
jgi:hypothetical protein